MTSTEAALAAELYRRVYGVEPPKPKQWEIQVHPQEVDENGKPKYPFYIVDKPEKIVHTYFHPGQMQAWNSRKRIIFMIAGKQSGKTVTGPLWLLREILENGGGDYLAVSATADLFIAKMLPALKQLFETEMGIANYWDGNRLFELCDLATGIFGATKASDHHKMWARIILRTAESDAGVQSFSARRVWLDEPGLYKPSIYKDIQARLAIAQGSILGTTTPYDLGWLKKEIYDAWEHGDPDIDVVNFISTMNPAFPQAEYDRLERTMQPWQFALDYKGSFGRPPAAIYEDFIDADRDEGGHKVKRFVIPKEWPRMVAVDPGIVNPGKIWVAHDVARDEFYIYRAEKGGLRRDAKQHAKDDVALAKRESERVIWWAVGAKSEKYWREDYQSEGAKPTKEPDSVDVEEGIDRMTRLIKQHRLFIVDDLRPLIDEIMSYSREIKNGEVTKNIKDKATFHLMDACRYFAMQVVKKRMAWTIDEKVGKYV